MKPQPLAQMASTLVLLIALVLLFVPLNKPVKGQGGTPAPLPNPILIGGFGDIRVGVTSWNTAKSDFLARGYRVSSPSSYGSNLTYFEVAVRDGANDFGDPNSPDIGLSIMVSDDIIVYARLHLYGADVSLKDVWENVAPARYIDLYGPPSNIWFSGESQSLDRFNYGLAMFWSDQKIVLGYSGAVLARDHRGDALRICLEPSRIGIAEVAITSDLSLLLGGGSDIKIENLEGIASYNELVDTLRQGECFFVSIYGFARPDFTPTIRVLPTDTPDATETPLLTETPVPTLTETPTPTETPTSTPTDTPTATATETPTPIPTSTFTLTPTNTLTPAASPTTVPTSTPTATIPARFSPLRLRAVCSPFPALFRVWRVENDNRFALPFAWQVVGTRQDGHGVALARFDSYFFTVTVRNNPNTVRILVRGVEQDVESSIGTQCR